MAERTILQLVDDVRMAAVNTGMDVSVKDVGFILSLFFEGMASHQSVPEVNSSLQMIADEVSKARDEH